MIQMSVCQRGGGDILPTTEGGDTSSSIEMSGDGGDHNFETETTDCMVSKGPTSKQLPAPQKGRMRLVKAGSCMSKPFWSQLSAMEIKFLSLYYAVMQCDFYLRGAPYVECLMDSSLASSIFIKDHFENEDGIIGFQAENCIHSR